MNKYIIALSLPLLCLASLGANQCGDDLTLGELDGDLNEDADVAQFEDADIAQLNDTLSEPDGPDEPDASDTDIVDDSDTADGDITQEYTAKAVNIMLTRQEWFGGDLEIDVRFYDTTSSRCDLPWAVIEDLGACKIVNTNPCDGSPPVRNLVSTPGDIITIQAGDSPVQSILEDEDGWFVGDLSPSVTPGTSVSVNISESESSPAFSRELTVPGITLTSPELEGSMMDGYRVRYTSGEDLTFRWDLWPVGGEIHLLALNSTSGYTLDCTADYETGEIIVPWSVLSEHLLTPSYGQIQLFHFLPYDWEEISGVEFDILVTGMSLYFELSP